MSISIFSRAGATIVFCVLAATACAGGAWAGCSGAEVKRLAGQGLTISAISRKCGMEKEEVRLKINQDDEASGGDDDPPDEKLPPGTPLGQCGCWGYVDPSYRQPAPQCRSGQAKPQACPVVCPTGGYAWRGVCT